MSRTLWVPVDSPEQRLKPDFNITELSGSLAALFGGHVC